MTEYPADSVGDVPFSPPLARSFNEAVYDTPKEPSTEQPRGEQPGAKPSAEQWGRIEALFERMQDSADPRAVAEAEPDPQVAAMAGRLWRTLKRAESDGFLAEPVELMAPVVDERPWFAAGQLLAGRFEVEDLRDAGGMGEVYVAFDRSLRERVAIKTIRRALAGDAAIRLRFLAEVQNARRVTHPNVCRINELFEESGLPFLSMEYLEGERLSTWLEQPGRPRRACHAIALQLAEGLAAAHRAGILHCDFKPANVILAGPPETPRAVITDFGLARALRPAEISAEIGARVQAEVAARSLRAGTLDYMAPELLAGAAPSVRTDIFAYGRVVEQLIPGHRLAARCHAAQPASRPASLDPVIRGLRGDWTRRVFFGTGIAAAAAVCTYGLSPRRGIRLASRTRIAVNGFRAGEPALATVFRELLITALRQSSLLMVMADDRLRYLLKANHFPVALPAERSSLVTATGVDDALIVEGVLSPGNEGLRVLLDIFSPAAFRPSLSVAEQVADPKQLVQLADRTALRLRREFGESDTALRPGAGYTPLQQVTSASPEAVELYFRGRAEQQATRTEAAVALYDQAIQIDPLFALAHSQRGSALGAHFQSASAVLSLRRAFDLRNRVTERERLTIETGYYGMIQDPVNALKSAQRLVTLFPEEAGFRRDVAFYLVRTGRPEDALPHSQRAAELDFSNDNNLSEWMGACIHANRFDQALDLCRRFREEGHSSTLLDWAGGVALMGKEQHADAVARFEAMGSAPERDRWARRLRCGALMMDGRFPEAAAALGSDLAWDDVQHEEFQQQARRAWLARVESLTDSPWRARARMEELLTIEASPTWFLPWREAAMIALDMEDRELAARFLTRIRDEAQSVPSTYSMGASAHIEGAILASAGDPRAADTLARAAGLLADPLTLRSLAQWEMRRGNWQAAAETLEKVEQMRGWTLRLFCPVNVTLSRILLAECYREMARFDDSLRLYEQVLIQWRKAFRGYRIVARLESARNDLAAREKQEKRHG